MRTLIHRNRAMAVHVLALTLLGCPASPKLNAGEVGGSVDLKELLPPEVSAPMAGAEASKVHRDTVLVGPKCAPVEVEWVTFQSGQGKYLLSAKARLLKPVEYDHLTFTRMSGATNAGTKDAPIEVLTFGLTWSMPRIGSTHSGTATLTMRADSESLTSDRCTQD